MDRKTPRPGGSRPVSDAAPAAARLAGRCLDRAVAAAVRLRAGRDPEALHDLRTDLRRLRVFLSAYRAVLGRAAAEGLRRKLKRISRATNACRDAQVRAAWLKRRSREPRRPAAGQEQLRPRPRGRLAAALGRLRVLAAVLRPRLRRVGRSGVPYARAAAEAVRAAARELERSCARLRRKPGQDRPAHAARIRVKRLRYLLEPFAPRERAARRLVRGLQELQTLLGDLHDAHGLAEAGGRTRRLGREEVRTLTRSLKKRWLSPGHDRKLIARCRDWCATIL